MHKNNFIDSDYNMHMIVDSLININNIITGFNDITLRKVKPNKYDKMYMDKDLIEDKLHEIIDQFNERKINDRDFFCITQQYTSIL